MATDPKTAISCAECGGVGSFRASRCGECDGTGRREVTRQTTTPIGEEALREAARKIGGSAAWAVREIERLRAALETARVRFEMLARNHPGASAEAGAKDAAEALVHGGR